jgi:hypothetical protein
VSIQLSTHFESDLRLPFFDLHVWKNHFGTIHVERSRDNLITALLRKIKKEKKKLKRTKTPRNCMKVNNIRRFDSQLQARRSQLAALN